MKCLFFTVFIDVFLIAVKEAAQAAGAAAKGLHTLSLK